MRLSPAGREKRVDDRDRPRHVGEVMSVWELPPVDAADEPLGDVWQSHQLVAGECQGDLRWTDQDSAIWVAECDLCGEVISTSRRLIDPEYRRERLVADAGLPSRYDGRTYEATGGNTVARAACRVFVELWDDQDRPSPPMLIGSYGTGKTHLLALTCQALMRRHEVRLRYWTVGDLMAEAKSLLDSNGAYGLFERAATIPLLVLDDIGSDRPTDWVLDEFQRVIDRRYQADLPVMGASNLRTDDWADVFGGRVASRLLDLCAPVPITGTDRRLA